MSSSQSYDEPNYIWEDEIFVPDEEIPETVRNFNDVMAANGGGSYFARFHITNRARLNRLTLRDSFEEMKFLESFLTCGAFRKDFLPLEFPTAIQSSEWEIVSARTLAEDWAQWLMAGGVYHKFNGSPQDAFEIAERACKGLFGDRFEDVIVFRGGGDWSEWFSKIGMDSTWVGIDKSEAKVWVVCSTDSS